MLNTFNIIWGPLEIFYGTPNLKKTQNFAFFALFGGSNSLLKMKILDVVTLGDDSDSLIRQITPKLFSALRLCLGDPKIAKLYYKNIFRLSYGSFFLVWTSSTKSFFSWCIYTPWILNFKKSLGRPCVPNIDMLYPCIIPKTFARSQPMSWGCVNIKNIFQKCFLA